MDIIKAQDMFAALSQSTRLRVLKYLIHAGPDGIPAGVIAERFKSRQNTMSTNLRLLQHAGLVTTERDGRHILYKADYEAVRGLIGFLMSDCCGGRPEICAPLIDDISRKQAI